MSEIQIIWLYHICTYSSSYNAEANGFRTNYEWEQALQVVHWIHLAVTQSIAIKESRKISEWSSYWNGVGLSSSRTYIKWELVMNLTSTSTPQRLEGQAVLAHHRVYMAWIFCTQIILFFVSMFTFLGVKHVWSIIFPNSIIVVHPSFHWASEWICLQAQLYLCKHAKSSLPPFSCNQDQVRILPTLFRLRVGRGNLLVSFLSCNYKS